MALLGTRKKQMFGGLPMPDGYQGGSGIGDGMIERQQMEMGQQPQGMGQLPDITNMPAMAQQPMQDEQPAKFKPNLLGVIGDAMQVFGGGQATYMQGVQEQQQRAEIMRQRAMQAQQERETGWQDWVAKEEWKKKNETPRVNDTEQDYNFWRGKVASGEITEEQFNDKMFAPRFIVDPATGQTIKIGGAAPAKPVGKLTPIGGPVQQAPGNFR